MEHLRDFGRADALAPLVRRRLAERWHPLVRKDGPGSDHRTARLVGVNDPAQLTALLRAWSDGDREAGGRLMSVVYGELKRQAVGYLSGERRGHTLQPTALVHEVYLRLLRQAPGEWRDRAQFFAFAARHMRQVLVDHARQVQSGKRGGGSRGLSLELVGDLAVLPPPDVLAVEEALGALAEFDPEGARMVELRFFAGLSLDEVAETTGRSRATVVRRWRAVRAWLSSELEAGSG